MLSGGIPLSALPNIPFPIPPTKMLSHFSSVASSAIMIYPSPWSCRVPGKLCTILLMTFTFLACKTGLVAVSSSPFSCHPNSPWKNRICSELEILIRFYQNPELCKRMQSNQWDGETKSEQI
jgi:hypothetical protein